MTKVYIYPWKKENSSWEHILRDILEKDYGMDQTPPILRDEMGKPYLEGNPLYFNVSHSGEYLALAVSCFPVGVDIQETRPIREGMYRKVVQPMEQCLIGEDREKDFLRLWALKESFVKAEGRGLRIPMKDYYFVRENGKYFVNFSGQRAGWTFNIEETSACGYYVSVCGQEKEAVFIWK